MLFPELFDVLERARWSMHSDIPWADFDESKISQHQLHGIKMLAILEWSAMPTAEMFLRDNQNDTDFSAFISLWFFEEQKHSLVFIEYLRRFAPSFMPTEDELAAVRFEFSSAPALDSLALHFCGEIRLNNWYRCALNYHEEPVIRAILQLLANDEARHARSYYKYMERALKQHGDQARASFSKVGVLMTNPRMNRAMHPINLHVNKDLYPNDTVSGRLPDPAWLTKWLDEEIGFDSAWEAKVERGILQNMASLFGETFDGSGSLRTFYKALTPQFSLSHTHY